MTPIATRALTQKWRAVLDDRSLISVVGADAASLLERLLTCEIPSKPGEMTAAALLSPQGKIQAAFLLARQEEGFVLDCPADVAASLIKRLTLYRLRADVIIADLSQDYFVLVAWNTGAEEDEGDGKEEDNSGAIQRVLVPAARAFPDPRSACRGVTIGHDLGVRLYLPKASLERVPEKLLDFSDKNSLKTNKREHFHESAFHGNALDAADASPLTNASPEAWHDVRRLAAVAEQGHDFDADEVFPTDVNLDQLGGVSYTKGCFVGQEVVSRMHHRSSERRRILRAHGSPGSLTPGAVLNAGDTQIGTLRSTHQSAEGDIGLALVRIDRLAAATTAGIALLSEGNAVRLDWPHWLESPQP